jgi:hypothetical protein
VDGIAPFSAKASRRQSALLRPVFARLREQMLDQVFARRRSAAGNIGPRGSGGALGPGGHAQGNGWFTGMMPTHDRSAAPFLFLRNVVVMSVRLQWRLAGFRATLLRELDLPALNFPPRRAGSGDPSNGITS